LGYWRVIGFLNMWVRVIFSPCKSGKIISLFLLLIAKGYQTVIYPASFITPPSPLLT